jgi:hypothetical protein
MKGSKIGQSLEFLVGLRLIQVCIGQYDLQFNLGNGVRISVTSAISLNGQVYPAGPQSTELARLLGAVISSIQLSETSDLHLSLQSGGSNAFVVILNSNNGYESFTITSPHGVLVV